MWQSRVEIKGYSVAYFNHITAFEAPYRWTSVIGGAHIHFIALLDIHASTKHAWAPSLTEVQRYGASNTTMRSKYVTEYNLWFLQGTATYVNIQLTYVGFT